MLNQLTRNWWVVALRGVLAIFYGLIAFVWPGLTLEVLVLFFGAYALVDGVFTIFAAVSNRSGHSRWWVLLLEGLVSVVAGLVAFILPGLTTLALLFVISFWAIATGILEIIAAIALRKEIEGEWMLAFSGVGSIIFGAVILTFPLAGAVTIAWLIGVYAIFFGVMFLNLSFRLRKFGMPQKTIVPAV